MEMHQETAFITELILEAAEAARQESSDEPEFISADAVDWPVTVTLGPGLEGAIACETTVGYVNGAKGQLSYRGYDIFDLCAHATYEEVSYLLLHGSLPAAAELETFKRKLTRYRSVTKTLRLLMGFPIEEMNTMGALRLGTNMMRQEFTILDQEQGRPGAAGAIGADEDSIAMETSPRGEERAIYEFEKGRVRSRAAVTPLTEACGFDACYHLISGVATISAAIARVREGHVPIEPDEDLGHAANFLYMITGRRPSPLEERIMDIALILHADHGMNASTFAAMVVASTLSDIYFSVGAGIAALNGPLHGGANEQVLRTLGRIGSVEHVDVWLDEMFEQKNKISGFGHRVYKAYDPRARILGPLAAHLARNNRYGKPLYAIARRLEEAMLDRVGRQKKVFPNVDFYSGIVYRCMGIDPEMYTPLFAVSRVAGWTARVHEYLQHNRIFRPRAMYVGQCDQRFVPVEQRGEASV